MSDRGWASDAWNRSEPARERLPRVEDLPVAEHGYDRDAVRAAFDAFYRHAAQLDATLQLLESVEVFGRQANELRTDLRALRAASWAPLAQRPSWTPGYSSSGSTRTGGGGVPEALPRLAVEAAFIILVAVGAALAEVSTVLIVALVLAAWLIVGIAEFVASSRRATFRPGALPVPSRASEAELAAVSTAAPDEVEPARFEATMIEAPPELEKAPAISVQPERSEEPEPVDEVVPAVAEPDPVDERPAVVEVEAPKRRRFWRRRAREPEFEPLEQSKHVRVLPPEEVEGEPAAVVDPWEKEAELPVAEEAPAAEPAVEAEPEPEPEREAEPDQEPVVVGEAERVWQPDAWRAESGEGEAFAEAAPEHEALEVEPEPEPVAEAEPEPEPEREAEPDQEPMAVGEAEDVWQPDAWRAESNEPEAFAEAESEHEALEVEPELEPGPVTEAEPEPGLVEESEPELESEPTPEWRVEPAREQEPEREPIAEAEPESEWRRDVVVGLSADPTFTAEEPDLQPGEAAPFEAEPSVEESSEEQPEEEPIPETAPFEIEPDEGDAIEPAERPRAEAVARAQGRTRRWPWRRARRSENVASAVPEPTGAREDPGHVEIVEVGQTIDPGTVEVPWEEESPFAARPKPADTWSQPAQVSGVQPDELRALRRDPAQRDRSEDGIASEHELETPEQESVPEFVRLPARSEIRTRRGRR